MTYPPDNSGGYPPAGGYGYPTPPPQGYGPPPPRSPWSSPLVIAAIVLGIVVVLGAGVGAYLLLRGSDGSDEAAASSSTTTTTAPGVTQVPGGASTSTTTTTTTLTQARPSPTVSGADWQGFLSGPRCNAADDPAVAIGRTARSRVVICQVGDQTGRYYYKGAADAGEIEVGFPQHVGNTFIARNGSVTYTVSPSALVIADGGVTQSTEPMLEYWAAS
jgi:serine/threonine-protein kinase